MPLSLSRIIHHSHSFTRLEIHHHIYFIAELRARSPIAKKIWETHECENFWLGCDVTFVGTFVRPSVRNPIMLMRPCLFGGKMHAAAARVCLAGSCMARCVYNIEW